MLFCIKQINLKYINLWTRKLIHGGMFAGPAKSYRLVSWFARDSTVVSAGPANNSTMYSLNMMISSISLSSDSGNQLNHVIVQSHEQTEPLQCLNNTHRTSTLQSINVTTIWSCNVCEHEVGSAMPLIDVFLC